jgi:hypothetical protein
MRLICQSRDSAPRISDKPGFGRRTVVIATLAALPCFTTVVAAQDSTASQARPNTQEFGIDAGMTVGFGTRSSVRITVPAERARLGFFLNPDTHWSIEPAAGLSYTAVKDTRGSLDYSLELGALYHFKPPTAALPGPNTVLYARPFIGLTGQAGGGGSNADFRMGAGLGIKKPFRDILAFRLEANAGYGFHNEAVLLGAFAGVSVFTHHRVL